MMKKQTMQHSSSSSAAPSIPTKTIPLFRCGGKCIQVPLLHSWFQSIALGIMGIGIIMGILTVPKDNHFTEFHHIIGILFGGLSILPIIVRLKFIQSILITIVQSIYQYNCCFLRNSATNGNTTNNFLYLARKNVRSYHKTLGYFITCLSIIPFVTGILSLDYSFRYIILYCYLGILGCIFGFTLLYYCYLYMYKRWCTIQTSNNDIVTSSTNASLVHSIDKYRNNKNINNVNVSASTSPIL